MTQMSDATILNRLYKTIQSRKGGDPDASHTARLFTKGRGKIAKKLGEESVETIIAALTEDDDALAGESADLLYHLLVLWADRDLDPKQVWEILEAREGTSGLAEKAARTESGKNSVR